MKLLSPANAKLKKGFETEGYLAVSFGLPAVKTCPYADQCLKGCYATKAFYRMSAAVAKRARNWKATLSNDFIYKMNADIETAKKKAERKGLKLIVRIHDSGDYFSQEYADMWKEISSQNSDVEFYSYTKSVKFFIKDYMRLPSNLRIIFSMGGKTDNLINKNIHRHCQIFETSTDLRFAGYADTSNDDSIAALAVTKFIGIVYHGSKALTFSTMETV